MQHGHRGLDPALPRRASADAKPRLRLGNRLRSTAAVHDSSGSQCNAQHSRGRTPEHRKGYIHIHAQHLARTGGARWALRAAAVHAHLVAISAKGVPSVRKQRPNNDLSRSWDLLTQMTTTSKMCANVPCATNNASTAPYRPRPECQSTHLTPSLHDTSAPGMNTHAAPNDMYVVSHWLHASPM